MAEHFQDPYRHHAPKGNRKSPDPSPSESHDKLTLVANTVEHGDEPFSTVSRKARTLTLHDNRDHAVATVVLFRENSADLDDQGRQQLKRLLPVLIGKRHKIELRGHASAQPLPPGSPFQTTWQLCYARCLATMAYLEQEGIARERFRLSQAAEFEPHTLRPESERQAANSRVEVYMLEESYLRLGLRLRHPRAPRRRRLRGRRGIGAARVARRQARAAAPAPAVPGGGRPLRLPDGHQQRRDARQRAVHHPERRRPGSPSSAPRRTAARSSTASAATSRSPASTKRRCTRRCGS